MFGNYVQAPENIHLVFIWLWLMSCTRIMQVNMKISHLLETIHKVTTNEDRDIDSQSVVIWKGIHSRSDTNRTGAEGLSFYYPRLIGKRPFQDGAMPGLLMTTFK